MKLKPKVVCVIMGGGRGSRLQPLTRLRAKPAVPLAGKYRLVDIPISNCINSGLNKIYVLTQFNTASLHQHIQSSYVFDSFGGGFVDILAAEQTVEGSRWYQGTADAVRQNLHHLHARRGDLILILSGDQLYRMDFQHVLEQHRQSGADVTLAVKPLPVSDIDGLGLVRIDAQGAVRAFCEKPTDPEVIRSLVLRGESKAAAGVEANDVCLANMGIYVFSKDALFEALADPSLTDMSKEVLPRLVERMNVRAFIFRGYWADIGTVRSFFEANLQLTDPEPPLDLFSPSHVVFTHARFLPASRIQNCHIDRAIIADGCQVQDATLQRCVIGVRSSVRAGACLRNVVMMGQDHFFEADPAASSGVPPVGIGRGCVIQNAIIDKNARIGNNVRLSPHGLPTKFDQGDISVRDGVLVVCKHGIVPDGTVLGELRDEPLPR